MDNNGVQMRIALTSVSNSAAWPFIKQLADVVIFKLQESAIAEDDPTKRDQYIHDVRGARRFWNGLLQVVVESQLNPSEISDPSDQFYAILDPYTRNENGKAD